MNMQEQYKQKTVTKYS